jgi:hypothetical protein
VSAPLRMPRERRRFENETRRPEHGQQDGGGRKLLRLQHRKRQRTV